MTRQQFGDATHYVQHTMLKMHGIYLLTKQTGDCKSSLYHLENFYVEVINSSQLNTTPLFKTYSIIERELDDYLCQIDLSSIHHLWK